jgi:hypothetical protein
VKTHELAQGIVSLNKVLEGLRRMVFIEIKKKEE